MAQRLTLEGLISQDDDQERKVNESTEDKEIFFETRKESLSPATQRKNIKSETPQNERRRQSNSSTVALSGGVSDLNTAEIDQKIEEYLVRAEDGTFSCGVCGKTGNSNILPGNQKQNMRSHVETHMEGLSFLCQSCGKTFGARVSLRMHKSKYHRS